MNVLVDSSAWIAILLGEPERATFVGILTKASSVHHSTVTLLESGLVARGRLGAAGAQRLDEILRALNVEAFRDATGQGWIVRGEAENRTPILDPGDVVANYTPDFSSRDYRSEEVSATVAEGPDACFVDDCITSSVDRINAAGVPYRIWGPNSKLSRAPFYTTADSRRRHPARCSLIPVGTTGTYDPSRDPRRRPPRGLRKSPTADDERVI